jgi:hypothetical protein
MVEIKKEDVDLFRGAYGEAVVICPHCKEKEVVIVYKAPCLLTHRCYACTRTFQVRVV